MKLPSWYGKYLAKHAEKQKALRKYSESLSTAARPLRTDAHSAPGWRDLGMEISCIPDAVYPWDREVLRAVREFDPGVVPIWVRWIFLSPQDTGEPEVVVFGRHGIARRLPRDPKSPEPVPLQIMGFESGRPQPHPHLIEFIWMGARDKRASDLPGAYKPFDWEMYHWMRNNYQTKSVKELVREAVFNPEDRRKAEFKKKQAEDDYRRADLERFVNNKLSQVSEVELRDHFLGDKEKKSKPTVDLGTTPKEP